MPLEVNEIGIVMRVRDGSDVAQRVGEDEPAEHREEWREELIDECVRRVLQALKMERER